MARRAPRSTGRNSATSREPASHQLKLMGGSARHGFIWVVPSRSTLSTKLRRHAADGNSRSARPEVSFEAELGWSQIQKINPGPFSRIESITSGLAVPSMHSVQPNLLLPSNREPERTHDVSGRCPLSSRDHGGISLKQWAAGAPVIGAAAVSSAKPKRPRSDGLPGSGAPQLF